MVEPLRPELRRDLKEVHEGLEDADIDRLEELIALRFTLDPERDAARLRAVDDERERLVRERMPHFDEVNQQFRARQLRDQPSERGPDVQVETRGRDAGRE